MEFELQLQDINIKNNCRICYESHTNIFKLFQEGYQNILKECCRIQVEENDGLPEVICEFCLKEMLNVHNFIIKCQNTDKKLRSLLTSHMKEEKTLESDSLHDLNDEKKIKFDYGDSYYEEDTHYSGFTVKDEPVESIINSISDTKSTPDKSLKKFSHKIKTKRFESSNEFPKKCSQCNYVAKCKSVMIIHTRTHTNEKPFLCSLCGRSFKVNDGLKAHFLRTHSQNKQAMNYQCHTCEKYFYKKKDLVVHIRIHTGETPYMCKHCPKKFSQVTSLTRHTRTHTGDKPFKCKICSKSFSCSSGLVKHQAVHTVERKFSCNVCGSLFKTKFSLQQHYVVHTNPKEIVCDQCGMCFNKRSNLTVHVKRMHSVSAGECTICKKKFSRLSEHMIIHSAERPFECHLCARKFNRKLSLVLHLRKHGNGKDFACQIEGCSETFPMQNMLVFHELKFHKKQTPFICKFCNKGYFRQCDLKKHLKVYHHADEPVVNEMRDISTLTYCKELKLSDNDEVTKSDILSIK